MSGDNFYKASDQPPYSHYRQGYTPPYFGSYQPPHRDRQRRQPAHGSSVWGSHPNYYSSFGSWSSPDSGPDYPYQRRSFHSQGFSNHPSSSRLAMDADHRGADEFGRTRPPPSPSAESAKKSRVLPTSPAKLYKSGNIPYKIHDNRPVTPPPPQKPSPSYMAVASEDPCHLSPDEALDSRKLLILDLNGTLLHRSRQAAEPSTQTKNAPPARSPGRPLPRLRVVHPRPYMGTFRSYLFAPETKSWLDVMIWSSAQPYSVNDMVSKTFGETQDELVAIWARDTLGLTEEHYAKKVQTFKDLTKPWTELPAILRSRTVHTPEPSSIQSTPRSSPHPSPPSSSAPPVTSSPPHAPEDLTRPHSAFTTLLLDDSARKAELQPYNHVCIPEYTGTRRALDLQAFQIETVTLRALKEGNIGTVVEDGPMDVVTTSRKEVSEGFSAEVVEESSKKKRKRKDKKVRNAAALADSIAEYQARPTDPYDHVLLAVIGILEEVKTQGNVAAWIRSGGLRGAVQDGDDDVKEIMASRDSNPGSSSSDPFGDDGFRESKRTKDPDELPSLRAAPTGNDDISSTIPSLSAGPEPAGSESDVAKRDGGSSTPAPMWFETARTVRYWADRGRRVLEEMGIPVVHGIEH